MGHFFGRYFHNNLYRRYAYCIALSWIVGILIGACISFFLKDQSALLMSVATNSRPSILGLCCLLVFPCFVLCISNKFSRLWPVCFFIVAKGICFGHAVPIALWTFGSAAWLFHFLLSFSSIMMLIPWFYFLIHWISSKCVLRAKEPYVLLLFALLFGFLDYFVIPTDMLML